MPFLLEKLAARPAALDGRQEAFDEEAAILAQIQRLFASRTLHDSGPSVVVQWGLPNPVEIGLKDMPALKRYAELARQAIIAHEPRLKDVSVKIESRPDALLACTLLINATRVADDDLLRFKLSFSREG